MSKFSWRNGFGTGLLVGICITVLFFVSVEYSFQEAIYWLEDLVRLEDTLAQWLMTAFSIIAAYLLWKTLLATQRMAIDTREIGEAQLRPYITLKSVDAAFATDPKSAKITHVRFRPWVVNTGQSPAMITRLTSDVQLVGKNIDKIVIRRAKTAKSSIRLGAGRDIFLTGAMVNFVEAQGASYWNSESEIIVCGIVEFTNVFGKPAYVETFCVALKFNQPLETLVEKPPTFEWIDAQKEIHIEEVD